MEHKHEPNGGLPMRSKANIAFAVFFLVAAYFLVTEHWVHLAGLFPYWPYLLLLACPLMHLFMHHGPGHQHGSHRSPDASSTSDSDRRP